MAASPLQIQAILKVNDQKNPNHSIAPTDRDNTSDRTHIMSEKDDIDISIASAREEIQTPRSPIVLMQNKPKQSNYRTTQFSNLRTNFIRKVLAILLLQLTITVGTVVLTLFPKLGVQNFMMTNLPALILISVLGLICLFILICKRDVCRKVPRNYILLFTYTFSMSYLVGCISAFTAADIVLLAGLSTILIVAAITVYACIAKQKASSTGMMASSFATTLLLILLLSLLYSGGISGIVYSALTALMFGMYLSASILRLVGKYEQQYSLDEYILASLDIYINIIQLFVAIMDLIRKLTSGRLFS
jgi:FtsH-binding integral membrane protein